jgi:hypothetical protein
MKYTKFKKLIMWKIIHSKQKLLLAAIYL